MASIPRSHTLVSLLLLAALGCESPLDTGGLADTGVHLSVTATGGLQFLTQDVDPPILMDALHRGGLAVDAAGCIRLAGPESAAVVGPAGFSARTEAGSTEILAPDGSVLGSLGGEFELGGGFVQELNDGLGFAPVDRALAQDRCPGTYWIVGEVPALKR